MLKELKSNPQFLTRREREILQLSAEGFRDKEIADELFISEMAVKENQVNLMRRLNAQDMSSAIDYALENGLLTVFEILQFRFSKGNKGSDDYIQ